MLIDQTVEFDFDEHQFYVAYLFHIIDIKIVQAGIKLPFMQHRNEVSFLKTEEIELLQAFFKFNSNMKLRNSI